ncbi:hypothetical protein KSS88_14735 [Bacillus altitudinis]|uniref:hypothetical protein n=1 Tax=Bacillus altitudinis TaxID=293387 RepID=UPI001C23E81B|nr:hypothetical protein [Bacillus altitudinis]MBU8970109.1 hypothetical protein [Bacillus altitudinis]
MIILKDVIATYSPLLVAVITILGGFFTWYLNERSKRKQETYNRKEERYAELVISLKGFYVKSENKDFKSNFLDQVNLCWLYCPDQVIYKLYNFLESVKNSSSDEHKLKALAEVFVEIRKDLIKDSKLNSDLKSDDFKIYSPTTSNDFAKASEHTQNQFNQDF